MDNGTEAIVRSAGGAEYRLVDMKYAGNLVRRISVLRSVIPWIGFLLVGACIPLSPVPASPSPWRILETETPRPASTLPQPSPSPASEKNPYALGISLEASSYNSRAFANIFKNDARVWVPGTMVPGPVDEQGMPTGDFDLYALDGAYLQDTQGFSGVYTLYFDGAADLDAGGDTFTESNYDAERNRTIAKLLVTEAHPTIILQFRNTRRDADEEKNTGVTGLKLMRPLTIGGSESYPPDAVFTKEYLELHDRGQVLRFMDFTATNGNIQREWNDRNTPEDLTFYGETEGYWWQGKGAPWEYAILLANTLDQDIWINIPTFASDDYVAQLADLLYAELEPDRKIYVEYSNELWNFGFPQWTHMQELVEEDLARNPATSINFDGQVKNRNGEIDYGVGVPRYWARRLMEISDLFRIRFGEESIPTRVRPLFETQAAWQHWLATGLLFLDRYFNNADGETHVGDPRPVKDYLWGGGGSGYVHGMPEGLGDQPDIRIGDVFLAYERAWPEHFRTMAADVYWLSAFGLKRVAYEAGPGLDDFAGKESAVQQAQLDPRMEVTYRRAADEFFLAGGDLYVTFLGVNLAHGLVPFDVVLGSQPVPKLHAFDAMLAAIERPAPTVGFPIPGVIPGGRYHVREDGWSMGDQGGSVRLEGPYAWASYTVNAGTTGRYCISLDVDDCENARATLWVDGAVVDSGFVCPAGGTTMAVLANLKPGLHAIRVLVNAGGFDVQAIHVLFDASPS